MTASVAPAPDKIIWSGMPAGGKHIDDKRIEDARIAPIESLGNFELKKQGNHLLGICPICRKKNFAIHPLTNTWHCACKKSDSSGTSIDFVQSWKHLSFDEAVVFLTDVADRRGVNPEPVNEAAKDGRDRGNCLHPSVPANDDRKTAASGNGADDEARRCPSARLAIDNAGAASSASEPVADFPKHLTAKTTIKPGAADVADAPRAAPTTVSLIPPIKLH